MSYENGKRFFNIILLPIATGHLLKRRYPKRCWPIASNSKITNFHGKTFEFFTPGISYIIERFCLRWKKNLPAKWKSSSIGFRFGLPLFHVFSAYNNKSQPFEDFWCGPDITIEYPTEPSFTGGHPGQDPFSGISFFPYWRPASAIWIQNFSLSRRPL